MRWGEAARTPWSGPLWVSGRRVSRSVGKHPWRAQEHCECDWNEQNDTTHQGPSSKAHTNPEEQARKGAGELHCKPLPLNPCQSVRLAMKTTHNSTAYTWLSHFLVFVLTQTCFETSVQNSTCISCSHWYFFPLSQSASFCNHISEGPPQDCIL